MNILTIYARPSPRSFCHAILEQFSRGLAEVWHTSEVLDLMGRPCERYWL
jgi:NAD(P)H dehydrogenase (quinone)